MPLYVPGSVQIGPRPSGSTSPTTIIEYLTSIGKDSWYARWIPTSGLASLSDGTGTVSLGGPVGCWAPVQQSGFNYKWIQATTSKRPTYGNQDSLASVYGDSTSWALDLNTSSALNGVAHCTFISYLSVAENRYVYSHDTSEDALQSQASAVDRVLTGGGYSNAQLVAFSRNYTGTRSRVKAGWKSYLTPSGAPRLFASTAGSSFSGSAIYEIVYAPGTLTVAEMNQALRYMAG